MNTQQMLGIGVTLIVVVVIVLGTAASLLRTRVAMSNDTAVVAAALIVGGTAYALSELLGLVDEFVGSSVRGIALGAAFGVSIALLAAPFRASVTSVVRAAWRFARRQWFWMLLNALGLLAIVLYGPSNYDAAAFHLARAAVWLQQGSLEHFPTHFVPQLDRPPVAEVWMAWTRGLSGTWDASPLVQWGSGVLLALSMRVILSRLIGRLNRLEESLVLISIGLSPMIIAQTTTPQVDLASVALIVAGAALLVESMVRRRLALLPVVGLGFGLAMGSKGTALVGIAAVAFGCLPWTYRWLREWNRARGFEPRKLIQFGTIGFVSLLLMFAPIAPTLARNSETFGTLAGPEQGSLVVSTNAPNMILANSLRQFGPNLQYGRVGGLGIVGSRIQLDFLESVSSLVGAGDADVSDAINHPSADPWGERVGRTVGSHEDTAGSPLVYNFALLVILLVAFMWRVLSSKERSALLATALVALGAALVSGKVIKLQFWGNRLTLPVTVSVLVFALLAVILVARHWRYGRTALSFLTVLASAWWLSTALVGPTRPLIVEDYPVASHRIGGDGYDRYFHDRIGIGADYQALQDFLDDTDCRDIGLGSFVVFELPLHVVAEKTNASIRSVNVASEGPPSDDRVVPCVIVREAGASATPSDVEMPFGYLSIEVP